MSEFKSNPRVRYKLSSAARSLVFRLQNEIEKGNNNSPFIIALMLAVAKDLLDLGFFIINTALTISVLGIAVILPLSVLIWSVGIFLSAFIFLFLITNGHMVKLKIRVFYYLICLFFNNIPGLNVLPMNTIYILYCWNQVKKEAKKAGENLENLDKMTEKDIRALNNSLSRVEFE